MTVIPGLLVDEEDRHLLESRAWRLTTRRYVRSDQRVGTKVVAIFLHREIMKPTAGEVVDHVNGNTLDNRRSNLRVVSAKMNSQNRPHLSITNTSGYRGVTYDRARRKWRAKAQVDGKWHAVGRFDSAEVAAEAIKTWRRRHMPGSAD